jgi:hypothetical protein
LADAAKVEREVDQDAIKKVYRTVLGVFQAVILE